MRAAGRLTGDLLARKGQAMPTGGFASPAIALSQLLAAPDSLRCAGDGDAAGGDRPEPPRPRRRRGGLRRVALTVRLDGERHRRLRIFGARHGCTSQEVILRALDAYLAACGVDCACLRGAPPDRVRN